MPAAAAQTAAAVIPGQLDVDEVLELVVRDERAAPAPAGAVARGEVLGPVDELVDGFVATLVATPSTQRTYERACRRFVASLGPAAGLEDVTAARIAAHHTALVRDGLASSTVKKERAALNSWLRWLVDLEQIPAAQARGALAVKLPRARTAERQAPKALSAAEYDRLLVAARAAIADDPIAGARDLAIVLVLGDGGLRCEELAGLQRRDFEPARKGAKLRALRIRHGKGDRERVVKLSARTTNAIVRWERARREVGPALEHDRLFITLGRRRPDGRHDHVGDRCGQPVLAAVMKRLGAIADVPVELRHPHALRHTCATELLRAGATIADVRTMLGHSSVKTTSIYLASDASRQEDVVALRERGRLTLDADRDRVG